VFPDETFTAATTSISSTTSQGKLICILKSEQRRLTNDCTDSKLLRWTLTSHSQSLFVTGFLLCCCDAVDQRTSSQTMPILNTEGTPFVKVCDRRLFDNLEHERIVTYVKPVLHLP
jgi:hypothetical protein